jgi:hypothetical protein
LEGTGFPAPDKDSRRRIDDPNDFVRIEIEAALKRGIRVIPVLIDGAPMPKAGDLPDSLEGLARRQNIEISHTRFEADADRLTRALTSIFEGLHPRGAEKTETPPSVEHHRVGTEWPQVSAEEARDYRLRADRGEADGQVLLGTLYSQGRGGVPKDEREAARLYRLAADQGYAHGQANLGAFYRFGLGGLPKDEHEAARLFKLAAAQGNEYARLALEELQAN